MRPLPLLLLAACPVPDKDTADTSDTADTADTADTGDTADSGDSGPVWDPSSTLCGSVEVVEDCATSLPPSVDVWTIRDGAYPCDDWDTGWSEPWEDTLVAQPPVVGSWFQDDLAAGDFAVVSTWQDCYACRPVTIVEGTCTSVDLDLAWLVTADKPNVYLYPEAPAPVRVAIGSPERLVAEDPAYPDGGWRAIAHPDGTLLTPEGPRDFLFYERVVQADAFQREEGWCVPGVQAVASMSDTMADMGFLPNEIADFREAWDADLPRAAWLTVYPQTADLPALRIDPPPDHLLRAWFVVEEGCHPVAEPVVAATPRAGWHAAEWGLALLPPLPREQVVVGGWR